MMTSPADFRARLESLLGTVHTADRAAEALGCTPRAVEYWFAGDRPVPLWAVNHLETAETFARMLADMNAAGFAANPRLFLPPRWQKPPPP